MAKRRRTTTTASSLLDAKDRLDASWEKAHEELCAATQGVSEADAQLRLLEQASVSKQKRDMFVVGLLYTILVDASQAPRAWADLAAIGQADHTVLVRNVGYLAQDKFPRLRASCQTQLLWLIDQMLESRIPDMHDVFVCALRQLSSNTATNKTRTGLLRQLLKIMSAHSQFLAGRRETVQACVYVLLRLMVEHHCIEALHPLRDAEIAQHIPLASEFPHSTIFITTTTVVGSIASVLFTRSSRRVIAMRIPPLVEAHLMFILTHLHTCEATKHVRWFTERHVGGEWAEPLVADLIRFICCNYHPSNKVLASPIVKRFEVVLQLLMSCSTNAGGQNAKLALFFDLLVFERGDNIMNIEPGILLLRHTSRNHPAVWATLIDFLVLIAAHLHPPIAQRVRRSVALGFNTAVWRSGRLMFFDGLIEQFGMSKTRSFSQLFDRIMTRLEEVAGKPGKESDAAFCASLAGALLPAVLVCLDDFGHSSADAIRETPLYMWPQLPEFPLPPASHHVLIARALDAQASQQTKFAALAQQLLSQLTAREPRMSLHVLLVALRDRSSRQRPQDSTAMRTYMRLHDKTNMRQLVEPVLRDISTAAADLPPLVDPLLLHAVHALGVACVSCNPVLLHALCARLSVRGWSALCHALSCIALPKLLVGDDQRDNDSDAQQPVASSYPAMPPPSAPVRLQRRVRRLWQTVIAAMALAGTAATTSTTDSASPPREYEADSGDGAALSATASHANASPNQHNHQQHHHSRRRWGIAASAAVRHRLMEVMDLELCMVDPAFSLEVVRQAPPAAAVHFHSAIARILTRLGPTAATLRLVIALQSSCAHVTASVVGVWAQQQAGQLFEAARTLLTHVEADVVREEKQRKDGDGGGDGDETGKVDASGGSPSPSWLWLNELNAFCKETTRGSNIISLVRGTLVKDLAVRETLVAIFTAAPPSWRTDFAALLSLSGIHTSSSSTTSTTQ
ncbi:hypothetical protein PTSG_09149 [Salpingoeca rosetta]|uniref:Integrator complex subunit 3 N-terminal domain-containing protein n=1 Tax=Salpingoeca rosetta (strain ATCC 50818 / BSB-021) TaxID=946362 RepID=F2UMV5_SALR5|nr:uncharacterized protein PTSG_09149 [Salpingoeca rosetta]EGD78454.1 hypothetical protein PTSG_09149 [Salpingoeca rosetta]|eukprot:XP_004989403.1 hypothetical protein PTSG_09149 [Salpingoeca rosetta]